MCLNGNKKKQKNKEVIKITKKLSVKEIIPAALVLAGTGLQLLQIAKLPWQPVVVMIIIVVSIFSFFKKKLH